MGECDHATAESILDFFYDQVSAFPLISTMYDREILELTMLPGRFVRNALSSTAPYRTYVSHSGNFIDTSNNYQFGESEMWIGEWIQKRGNRDQIGMYISSIRGKFRSGLIN